MNIEKTGLPLYVSRQDGTHAVAALITEIMSFDLPNMPGCVRVKFGEINKESSFIPSWATQNNPQIGRYFVLRESGQAICVDGDIFNNTYSVK